MQSIGPLPASENNGSDEDWLNFSMVYQPLPKKHLVNRLYPDTGMTAYISLKFSVDVVYMCVIIILEFGNTC